MTVPTNGIPIQGPDRPGQVQPTPAGGKGEEGDFGRILADLQRLGDESARDSASLTGTDRIDPADLVRRIDDADLSFRKAMEIRRNLEEAWNRARNPYKEG